MEKWTVKVAFDANLSIATTVEEEMGELINALRDQGFDIGLSRVHLVRGDKITDEDVTESAEIFDEFDNFMNQGFNTAPADSDLPPF